MGTGRESVKEIYEGDEREMMGRRKSERGNERE